MEIPQSLKELMACQVGMCRQIPDPIRRDIARHRKTPFVQQFAGFCQQYIESYENQDYDADANGELFLLNRLADEGVNLKTVFDIGSNVGNWTQMVHGIFPNAEIHCFEIIPQTREELAKNVAGNDNVIVSKTGLYDRNGEILVKHYPESSKLSSVVQIPHAADHVVVAAEVATGDSYVQEHSIEHIDFVKIDVEGSENCVLAGLLENIERKAIDIVQFEYGLANVLTRFLLIDFYAFFILKGYVLGKIYPNHVEFKGFEVTDENFLGPNYLAVRSDREDLIEMLSRDPGDAG